MDLVVGDKIKTKKPHACGKNGWTVTRTGADFKLTCLYCGRTVMITSEDAKKIIKEKIEG